MDLRVGGRPVGDWLFRCAIPYHVQPSWNWTVQRRTAASCWSLGWEVLAWTVAFPMRTSTGGCSGWSCPCPHRQHPDSGCNTTFPDVQVLSDTNTSISQHLNRLFKKKTNSWIEFLMICSRFYWDSFIIPKIRSLTKRACIRISSGSETASSSCSWEAASTVFSKAAIGDCPWGLGNAVEPFSYLNKRGQIQSDISLYSSNKNHGIELNMKHTQTQWDDSIDEWDKAGFFAEYFRNGSGGKGRGRGGEGEIKMDGHLNCMACFQYCNAPSMSLLRSTKVAPSSSRASIFSLRPTVSNSWTMYSTMCVWPVTAAASKGVIPMHPHNRKTKKKKINNKVTITIRMNGMNEWIIWMNESSYRRNRHPF